MAKKKSAAKKKRASGKQSAGGKKESGGKKRAASKRGTTVLQGITGIGLRRPVRPQGLPRLPQEYWRPPTANGHFDRLFFALCSHDHQLLRLDGFVVDFNSGNPIPFSSGGNGPMSITEVLLPGVQAQHIVLTATLDFLGVIENWTYDVDVAMVSGKPNELLECAVFGLAVHDLNGAPSERLFGTLFGTTPPLGGGPSYGVPDGNMMGP